MEIKKDIFGYLGNRSIFLNKPMTYFFEEFEPEYIRKLDSCVIEKIPHWVTRAPADSQG